MSPADPSSEIELSWLTLDEARRLPPLPSGYTTDCILRLVRHGDGAGQHWDLQEVVLSSPLTKTYDHGSADEWLESYLDEAGSSRIDFLAAWRTGTLLGLLACRRLDWNKTVWLLDIRVLGHARRSGVGSALIQALKIHASSFGARGILVETQTTNVPAVRFYVEQGFAICGFNDHLYGNDDLERGDVALYLFCELDAGS